MMRLGAGTIVILAAAGAGSCGPQEEAPPAAVASREAAPAASEVPLYVPPTPAPPPEVDPESCETYDTAYHRAPLMRVRGGPAARVPFQNRAKACPTSGECAWRRRGFVVGGDVVLVSSPVNGFRCAYFASVSAGDVVSGFLPADSLEPTTEGDDLTPEFLTGVWSFGKKHGIAFRSAGGRLTAEGWASYGEGMATNLGEFEGPIQVNGRLLQYGEESDCWVSAVRRGPYLVVDDNAGCGGVNVRFTGIYVKTSDRPPAPSPR